MRIIFFSAILATLSILCFAGTRDPSVPDEKYLEHGDKFSNVVPIKVIMSEREVLVGGEPEKEIMYASASCVIIRPHWAVTAGHVVYKSKSTSIKVGERYVPVARTIIHHKYDDDIIGINDIALCYSDEDFKMEKYHDIYTKVDELGKDVDIAGYGWEGDFAKGMKTCDGKRRAGKNKIEATSADLLFCSPSSSGSSPLEFMITPGDSGGGLFIEGRLAGINSFLRSLRAEDVGKSLGGRYGQEAAFVRVSAFADWMDEQMEKHSRVDAGVRVVK